MLNAWKNRSTTEATGTDWYVVADMIERSGVERVRALVEAIEASPDEAECRKLYGL